MSVPPYRDYLPESAGPDPEPPRPIGSTPRVGFGVLYVNVDRHGNWRGSWQDDGPSLNIADVEGTQEQVETWAREQPAAAKWMLDRLTGRTLPIL